VDISPAGKQSSDIGQIRGYSGRAFPEQSGSGGHYHREKALPGQEHRTQDLADALLARLRCTREENYCLGLKVVELASFLLNDLDIRKLAEPVLLNTAAILGEAMLGFLPEDEARAILIRRGLPRLTSTTITNQEELMDQLKETRKTKIVHDHEENELGIYCVGTPIFNYTGKLAEGVSVSGSVNR